MLEKSRVTARIAEVREARDLVEGYAAVFGDFPPSLAAAYDAAGANYVSPWLVYCREEEDGDNGHGNDCGQFDRSNPSGNAPVPAIPAIGYLVRTVSDLAPACERIDYVFASCCGAAPRPVGYGKGRGPGNGGQGGKG